MPPLHRRYGFVAVRFTPPGFSQRAPTRSGFSLREPVRVRGAGRAVAQNMNRINPTATTPKIKVAKALL
ncbi:MAG: hypothetical protein QME16_08150 [Planctomycetota bacterium]|nr:hypothetical protein [Planctomycetota bacterium]